MHTCIRVMCWGLALTLLTCSSAVAQGRVTVKDFEFEGNTQVTSERLSTELDDLRGQDLTFQELQAAADRLTDLYRAEGFFTVRAALPTQDIKNGLVRFSIVESKLGNISIQGNERYSTEFLNWYLEPIKETEFPDRHLVQRQLLLLNEFPDLEVSSIVEAGEDPNTVDVIFDVVDDHPTHFSIDYNNFGSRFNGRNRVGATLDFGNLSGNGDRLVLRGLRSLADKGVTLGTLNYSIPVSNSGTRASFLVSNAAYAVGQDLEILDIRGDAIVAGAFISHPFIRTTDWNLDLNGGFLYQNVENLILGQAISRDRLREVVLGVSTDWSDSRGRNYFNARMTQDLGSGFGGLSPNDPLSSRQAGGGFHKWNFDLARVHSFSPKWFGIARVSHQYANQPLPNAEQYALGGIDSVRGYTQAAYLGDAGYNASAEIRWQPIEGEDKDLLQLAAFIDHGGAYLKRPAIGEINNVSLTGAGFGVRLNLPEETIIRADIGWALGSNEITDLVGKDPVTYLTFGKTF
jgi:hemolysin activation/secretion protein